MRSLKRDLAVWTSLGAIALSVAAGVLIYFLTSAYLTTQFDETLARKARVLASSIELDNGDLEFGFQELDMSEFASPDAGGYLQVYLDGKSLYRSPSLGGQDLRAEPFSDNFARVGEVDLPGARAGRCVVSRVMPVRDPPGQTGAVPVTVCVARDVAELNAPLAVLRWVLIGVGALLAACVSGVTYLAVSRGLRPVDDLARSVGAVDEHTLARPIELPALPRELVPIVDQFNGLMTRIRLAFERERRFSADLAHELRTPLSGLRTTIDVARARPRSPEEHRQCLDQLLHIARQMQTLIEGLLQLARLERGLVSLNKEPVNLDDTVRGVWQAVHANGTTEQCFGFDIRLSVEHPIRTDPALLTVALRNVLHNALTYVDEGGTVTVATRPTDSGVELSVANTGSRVSESDIAKVFDRFWRADAARSDTGTRFGLGLALARQAVEALGGQITASSQPAGVFAVTITLPN